MILEKITHNGKFNKERCVMKKSHKLLGYTDDLAIVARNGKEVDGRHIQASSADKPKKSKVRGKNKENKDRTQN